jgi:hypothetical protein
LILPYLSSLLVVVIVEVTFWMFAWGVLKL